MKLQIAFDMIDIDEALRIAQQVEPAADVLEIGSLLIYRYGIGAVEKFRTAFPKATLLADIKIADRAREAVSLCVDAGADWVTVLAGTSPQVIKTACTTAHELGKRVMLDLIDASSVGQSALEAQSLGVDAILFHKPADARQSETTLLDSWDMVRGNTTLPLFIAAPITRETVHDLIAIQPAALVIGKPIVQAADPAQEAIYYRSILKRD